MWWLLLCFQLTSLIVLQTSLCMHACLSLNDLVGGGGGGGRQHTVGLTVDFHIELETSHLA